jgi:hypothetical protein
VTRPGQQELVESATTAIEHILRMPILDWHKRRLVSGAIWFITEAGGKYKTRYRSRASLDDPSAKLHHEHVFTRKDLTARLMADPEQAREILQSAIACVVTVEEHRRLAAAEKENPQLRGWERYQAAGIEVVDTETEIATEGNEVAPGTSREG